MQLHEAPVAGPIGPMRDGIDTAYWDGLNEGEFRIQRCPDCRSWNWGATWRCPQCGCWDMGWEPVEPAGSVYTWIRTHQAFAPEFVAVVPYVSLMVELPQAGGVRVLGNLVGDETGLACGAPVHGVIQPAGDLTSGQAVMRWLLVR